MDDAFEIRRRTGLYLVLVLLCLALAGGFGWLALDRREPLHGVIAGVLLVLGLNLARGLRDARTPLFVADDHGVRLRGERGWVGLLWSELGEIKVEPREGVRHDPRIKVVSTDGRRFYTSPLGLATSSSPQEAEVQLARRREAAAY
ncbi:hypothetical protein [Aeromicrobium fastidiosum]|uniref:PH domain-containing protein n=1 Tax=Aeromicrobium fastidiosum TaxID=52699 RepID=A0A641AKV7_9ACTN|nr:hypothetical protein [Aeromicrobium fastidiosum]KAA1376471.1 hypothetical protein ESP62_013680 [Aeromicrobium fastidiosum]MBP2391614.1 hypothetical protein [Aeromicrobium fastidiosum]